jgi:hypothetical protein
MSTTFTLATQTLFAELQDRSLDAAFDTDFDAQGSFIKKRVKTEDYWYFQRWIDGKAQQKYVGPARDPEVTRRVETFTTRIKSDFQQRREMVRALLAAGLPRPDPLTGNVVEALWKAGFFRLRGFLIGTVAYQCYAGLLGAKLGGPALRTQDADFAQHLAISRNLEDSIAPIKDVLGAIDPTFRAIPHQIDGRHTIAYVNASGYRIEFLTPHRGSADRVDKPVRMPALGGASAMPLRFLDFLIHEPTRSVLLHKAGIPVAVPSPQRYAVHKLIVAARRPVKTKVAKDIAQASQLIAAMGKNHWLELSEAWIEAWERGPKWRDALRQGRLMLSEKTLDTFRISMAMGCEQLRRHTSDIGWQLPNDL